MSMGGSTTQKTDTGPWKEIKDENLELVGDAMSDYRKGNPGVWGENKGQNYIADQSKATLDAQKNILKIANQNPAYVDNAAKAINSIETGNAFGTKDDDVLKKMMNGVSLGNDPSASRINDISSGAWMGKDPGADTVAQAQKFNMAGTGTTQDVMKDLAGANMYDNGAIAQAANLNNFRNAGIGLQQQQANSLKNSQNSASQYLTDMASGRNVMGDPTLDARANASDQALFSNFANIVKPQITSQAALAGRTGSGAAQQIMNQGMSDVMSQAANARTNLLSEAFKTGTANQLAAAGQLSNNYNSDVSNAMNANANLANTSNSQQNTRISGINTYGDQNTTQNAQQLAAQQARLAAAGQLGDMSLSESQQRLAAANANNAQYNTDRATQMQALGMQQDQYNQNIQNKLANNASMINAANSYSQNQNADAQVRLQAAGMAGDQRALDYYDEMQRAQIGQQQDARNDAELLARQTKYNALENKDMNNIANMMSVINGNGWNSSTATTTPSTMSTLGSLGTLLGGLFSLSDEREKEGIKAVGKHPSGLVMYEWKYRDDPSHKKYVGPMAQDVEKMNPAMVREVNGRKMVRNSVLFEGV